MELLRGLAKSSYVVSNVAWMAAVRQRGRALWLAIIFLCLEMPCGVWVASIHKLCELLCELGCRVVFCVLNVEPFVSFVG